MLDFYIVNELYLDYLRSCGFTNVFDTKNPNYVHDKFVFGIVFNIDGMNYYAQVSSLNHNDFGTSKGKENYLHQDENGINLSKLDKKYRRRLFPIHDYTHTENHIIAFLRFDFMFPVHQKDLTVIEIDDLYTGDQNSDDPKDIKAMQYQILMSKEYKFCVSSCAEIDRKANALYRAVTNLSNPDNIRKYCIDFRAIEKKYAEWVEQKQY